ncbi:biogenesis of lysosome-related organelles complex 1 subunit 3-like [Culicoides brevitarsis]|uniref:biogenesis of lysosome-related organelles complex 1 subunit 3-like n=1 Tax=Culicoides brevitarsis TaxID=469753 RepID=UPI00307B52E8
MSAESQKIVSGEASETDEESENASGTTLKESIENALNSNTVTQSLVIQGEDSESDEDLPRTVFPENRKFEENSSTFPKKTQDGSFLMKDLQEDVTNSLKWLIQETQEDALDELNSCNQLLLSSQVVLQKDTIALKQAANNLESISKKLDDILSFNIIPQIEFQRKNVSLEDVELELGIDTLTNEMIDML